MAIIVPDADPVESLDGTVTNRVTSVYLYYDARDALVYVGITSRAIRRQDEHSVKEWWPFVARQEVIHCDTRDQALAMERDLIQELQPPFNRQHNRDHEALRAAYLAFADVDNVPKKPSKLVHAYGRRLPLVVHRQDEASVVMRSVISHAPMALAVSMRGNLAVMAGGSKPWGELVDIKRSGIATYFYMRGKRLQRPILGGWINLGFEGQLKDEVLRIRGSYLERYAGNLQDGVS